MTDLDLADDSVAGIVAFWSVIHVPDHAVPGVFDQFRRVLRPQGLLLVGFHVGDETRHTSEGYTGRPINVDSHRRRPGTMSGWLRDAGFTIEAELVIGPDEDVPGRHLRATSVVTRESFVVMEVADVASEVVAPAVRAVFKDGEVSALELRAVDELGGSVELALTARGETSLLVVQTVRDMSASDWSETCARSWSTRRSRFGWGRQRRSMTQPYGIPWPAASRRSARATRPAPPARAGRARRTAPRRACRSEPRSGPWSRARRR